MPYGVDQKKKKRGFGMMPACYDHDHDLRHIYYMYIIYIYIYMLNDFKMILSPFNVKLVHFCSALSNSMKL